MTEYGRDSGSQPWHPGDPHYGEQGYEGQQYPQQSQQPQQPYYGHPEQQQYGWDPAQGTGSPYGHAPQAGTYPPQGDPYAGNAQDHYGGQGSYPPPHQQQGMHQQGMHQQTHEQLMHQQQQQQQQQGVPQQHQHQQHQPQQEQWQADPDPGDTGELSFFDGLAGGAEPKAEPGTTAEADDEPAEESPRGRERRGKGKDKKNKRRSGTACLVASVVLLGTVGGIGYVGYDYWETHYGPAPDYQGEGTGQVQIEVPKGAGLTQIGDILAKNGVVKSARAFSAAASGKSIQPGTYTLRKEMSGEAAVAMMTNAGNFLTLREGIRAAQVYKAIDDKLGLKPGTTKDVAKAQAKNLGLPDWADSAPDIKDPLEGFLFPSQYNAGKGTKPEDLLRQMVDRAKKNYAEQDLDGKARELGLKSPLQVITVASLVQAEGRYPHDFDKISRVIYNRLKPDNKETYGLLDFDSTVNYAKSQSTLDTGSVNDLRKFKDPYNTYSIKGLPPGPIGNPGAEALKSALDPAPGPWYYFVSVNENETLFAVTNEEQNKNRQRYEQEHKKAAGQ
ncbi:endolytic transglycosylase MltG [Streptomyces orinoci]|uniref:Endolytic murein transglycosylase n=1 Tax=Streptomyces orinoci TaxID=67339 RepID=A0ABV3JWE5_STRON|nr:endolytic transglycosylase MltG [Streptomyces orinoci]